MTDNVTEEQIAIRIAILRHALNRPDGKAAVNCNRHRKLFGGRPEWIVSRIVQPAMIVGCGPDRHGAESEFSCAPELLHRHRDVLKRHGRYRVESHRIDAT